MFTYTRTYIKIIKCLILGRRRNTWNFCILDVQYKYTKLKITRHHYMSFSFFSIAMFTRDNNFFCQSMTLNWKENISCKSFEKYEIRFSRKQIFVKRPASSQQIYIALHFISFFDHRTRRWGRRGRDRYSHLKFSGQMRMSIDISLDDVCYTRRCVTEQELRTIYATK